MLDLGIRYLEGAYILHESLHSTVLACVFSFSDSGRQFGYYLELRPRTRWADVVQRDALRLLGIRGWRRRAENRDEWRHFTRETKARKGL
jgi:hypothetical protein